MCICWFIIQIRINYAIRRLILGSWSYADFLDAIICYVQNGCIYSLSIILHIRSTALSF